MGRPESTWSLSSRIGEDPDNNLALTNGELREEPWLRFGEKRVDMDRLVSEIRPKRA